ncbi:FAD-dependent monooxygenase [Kribbella sandramycini]|uniref:2-polyprenyl-6-methoxyphenol hydroxylase-like FAD-dependent oxidoreductase n=1 Tax=Kribbella sandramycini TaxID=60450 RepID=A0A7Y4NZR2_9ACTN|nr:NAD(P)/FAD-dependent oxidoreductase [Kribbella sandramycini]MBB6565592.1 2-polyprenyl-6-methoxyphenol hydroxylase-like FAD-dependent oxidoreductase [Kribbella sandramycini]NOL41856.1 FAD-dependent monooxygenase [Kribbella sandramycini]
MDVVVVGAGPVGLAAAAALRQQGRSVLVVDRLAAGANTSRAAVIHARTLEMLETIGVSKRLVELGLPLQDFTIREGERVLVPVSMRELPSAYAYTLMIPQSTTEQVLLDRLEELGGSVLRPRSAAALTQDADAAHVTLDDGQVIDAQYVVAADGMHSTIRELAGITMPGDTLSLSCSLVDVRVDGGLHADEVALYFAKAGLLVVAPLPDGSFRLVAEVADAPEHPDLAFAQGLIDARGSKATVTEVVWGSRFRIHERVADSYRAGRVLLAGDSAHTHSPAGGQGMNLGLRDAISLAGALSTALATGDERELDEYAVRGRAEAVRVIALAHRLTRLANVPRPVRPLRNAVLRVVAGSTDATRGIARQLAGYR